MIGDGTGKRPWVYAAASKGAFRTFHHVSGWVLIVFYLALPWLTLGGDPVLRIDLGGRKLHLLGWTFTSHDTVLVLAGLLFSAIGLGLATALYGRVWCGYACPQTVFLEELVRRIEHLIEGDRGARRKLDSEPWHATKIAKKLLKWTAFALFAWVLAMTFVSYFVDPKALWTFGTGATSWSFVGFFTVALFVDFAWFREQFCNYLCPYARIQGALADEHSLVVGYDTKRGEPRFQKGKLAMKDVLARAGCVDCHRCVAVCPQGIDIRNGYQLECITCGHCIDACGEVMGRHGATSLITYTTEARLAGVPAPRIRPRPILYGVLLLAIASAAGWRIASHGAVDVRVTRTVGVDFLRTHEGDIQNAYVAHLFNNSREPRRFTFELDGLPEARVVVPNPNLTLAPGQDLSTPLFVIAPLRDERARSTSFRFVIRAEGDELVRPGIFLQPEGGPR